MKILLKILTCIFLFISVQSIKLDENMIRTLKQHYDTEQNLLKRVRLGIIINHSEYLTNDGEYYDLESLKKAIRRICVPVVDSFFEEWIIENIDEKIPEYVRGLGKTIFNDEEFVNMLLKIDVEKIVGTMPYNKIKDLTIESADPKINLKVDL